ncbi:MAG: class I SAM-dependent methyltransferase, partial [Bacteroidota bacterium]
GMVFKTIQFSDDSLDKPVKYRERVKLYGLEWFRNVLGESGFKIVETYGDYDGAPFLSESPRLIIVAKLI